jgi:hypothetical protein
VPCEKCTLTNICAKRLTSVEDGVFDLFRFVIVREVDVFLVLFIGDIEVRFHDFVRLVFLVFLF